MRNEDEKFMLEAIKEAKKALTIDEVPIGAVIVIEGKIVARAHNNVESKKSALAHAEILAIQKATKKLGDFRLPKATLYVTVEPCACCAGAISNSRIDKVVFGCCDKVFGGVVSCFKILDCPTSYKRVEYVGNVLEEECAELVKNFFASKRGNKVK